MMLTRQRTTRWIVYVVVLIVIVDSLFMNVFEFSTIKTSRINSTTSFGRSNHQEQPNSDDDNDTSIPKSTISEIKLLPRVWNAWPINQTLCYEPPLHKFQYTKRPKKEKGFPLQMNYNKEQQLPSWFQYGFLFTKPKKVGGSTATGINLRISKNMKQRLLVENNNNNNNNDNNNISNSPVCDGIYDHSQRRQFMNRMMGKSFLWSIIRDPTKRSISEFYHFSVSRFGLPSTLENFQQNIHPTYAMYYIKIHSLLRPKQIKSYNHTVMIQTINDIIQEYDYIAITERFDESMVVMSILLNIPLGDMLYLKAKSNGGYDGGGSPQGCTYILPSNNLTIDFDNYLQSTEWKQIMKWDQELYNIVNQSLDMTIDSIGRQKFEQRLKKFNYVQEIAQRVCGKVAKYPCTNDGKRRLPSSTNCLFADTGCAYHCLDQIANELNISSTTST